MKAPFLPLASVLLLAAGCAVGPDYSRPPAPTPIAFGENAPWKPAAPKDSLPKGSWWRIFKDPTLDQLEESAAKASPNLQAALARFDEALAAARISRSALYPSAGLNASGARERFSGNRQSQTPATRFAYTTDTFDLPVALSYEIDLFGSVRRTAEAATAFAQSQGAAYENVRLSLEAGVAQNYFTLRSLTAQRDLLVRNASLLKDALLLVKKLRDAGAGSDLDLFQAQAELASVEAQAAAAERAVAVQRHALAVLVGQTPEGFSIEAPPLGDAPIAIPVGLPSDLLERRPDVASAERALASANARIGAAKAAFFPSISLTASGGLNSNDLSNLLGWSSREWALAPGVTMPLLNAGATLAGYRQAQAAYQEALANYRSQVLNAFEEVEDGLSDLRLLTSQEEALSRASSAASEASRLAGVRYKAGLVSYLSVIDAERTAILAQTQLEQARGERLAAAVLLVRALGGGW